ncbi:MAG: heavy metal response regulator transcription factor [Gammaproteobacteria bacterium]|nr:heavy metal response regulator transcription factor [Gammaproteobacteria bacterium]
MKILLIEDEKRTAHYLKKGLSEQGFTVATAYDGIDGLFKAKESEYDLIILDVMLPHLDGWAVLSRYRQINASTPILLLTACDDVNDRVKGLELGADDYLIKPFAFSELVARVQSLIRRCQVNDNQGETGKLTVADLVIDYKAMRVTRHNQLIQLTAKEFALLCYLVKNRGKIVSRTMIAEQVWDINFDSETNIIDVAIKRLREKIDKPFAFPLIHTKRGLGYSLEDRHHESN